MSDVRCCRSQIRKWENDGENIYKTQRRIAQSRQSESVTGEKTFWFEEIMTSCFSAYVATDNQSS